MFDIHSIQEVLHARHQSRHAAGDSEAVLCVATVAREMHLAGRFGRFTPDASVLAELDVIR